MTETQARFAFATIKELRQQLVTWAGIRRYLLRRDIDLSRYVIKRIARYAKIKMQPKPLRRLPGAYVAANGDEGWAL